MSVIEPMFLSLHEAVLLDVLCALTVYVIYKRFEVEPLQGIATLLLLGVAPSLPVVFLSPHFPSLRYSFAASFAIFYTTLVSSIILYRISPLHPLASYPGPFLARVSKFWGVWVMSYGKNHISHKDLHKKYGPYVRIGPNELSIADADVIPAILGADGMPKGPMWDIRMSPRIAPSLVEVRTFTEHARRRKRWNRAFSIPSTQGYAPLLAKRALQLVDALREQSRRAGIGPGNTNEKGGCPIDLAQWIGFFSFDFMGDMVFGGGFELMHDEGDKIGIWHLLVDGDKMMALLQHTPWLARFLLSIPFAMESVHTLVDFAFTRVKQRKADGSTVRDLFHHLIDEDSTDNVAVPDEELMSDGILAIIAGSETTSTALSGLFYFLLAHPADYSRLQAEVDAAFPYMEGDFTDPFDEKKLREMPFLNAVINETMRLQPPVGSSLQRAPEEGSGGKMIGSHFIPEGTAVVVPPYALHTDPRYFSPAPDAFWPDRWLQESARRAPPPTYAPMSDSHKDKACEAVITNKDAFIPFSYGPANCAGRTLALLEMRAVVALLMQRFEMRFADGYDSAEWVVQLEDWFMMHVGRLPVVLAPRS